MNAPIEALYATSQNLYAVLFNPNDGTVWRFDTSVWEVFNSGHWASYAVPLTEYAGTGYYRAAYPIASPTVLSTDIIFARAGGSPALGDPPATSIYKSQGANIAAIGNALQNALNMAAAYGTEQIGAVSGTPASPTVIATNLTSAVANAYAGRAVVMTSGALIQQAAYITGYDGAGMLTINGFPGGVAPANSDTFIIL